MLHPGQRLGPYEIVSRIGAGGMGEVFKARDTRLERSVAVKVLPSAFASNAQLKLRFEREARAISQFAHPHICTLYDVGSEDGVEYLVMEYLEGESLADRLSKGPLPIDQVLRYGIEIADALDRAHKAGIVHRDLKPGNVMLTRSGAKLLDFGLAKEAEPKVVSASMLTERQPLTEEGTIVGTFQYMAPEQLEGGAVDARTDIFALGVMLYEMATGRRAFQGKTKASLIAAILATQPPPIGSAQKASPPALDRVIRTCLEKEPDDRFQSAHDVGLELQWMAEPMASVASAPVRKSRFAAVAAVVLAIVAAAATAMLVRDRIAHSRRKVVRTAILPPANAAFDLNENAGPPELSPDGLRVVFSATDGTRRLWVRALDSGTATPLIGTENATFPFWSPDSRYVAFFAGGKLMRVDITGGSPIVLCDAQDGRGGSWSGTTIIFGCRYTGILRVPSAGGTPVAVTDRVQGRDISHRWPRFLPDGEHFLYLATPVGSEDPRNQLCVGSLSRKMRKPVVQASSQPLYYDGHILYVRDGLLTAHRFDEKKLESLGDPVPLPEQQILSAPLYSRSIVTVAGTGTLLYQTGTTVRMSELVWYDRTGKELSVVGEPAPFQNLSLSPDGKRVVASTRSPAGSIWLYDLNRSVKTRLTFGDRDGTPVWAPDGRHFTYGSLRRNFVEIYLRDVVTGTERLLVSGDGDKFSTGWSPDGTMLFFNSGQLSAARSDIGYVTLADNKPRSYLATPFAESYARMSPDGKWVTYQSSESGRAQVYVAPFPPTGEKVQVSANGGIAPRWRSDGREIYFVDPLTTTLLAAPITLGTPPEIGAAVELFRFRHGGAVPVGWDVANDGQRFLVNAIRAENARSEPLTLVQNFDVVLREALRKD